VIVRLSRGVRQKQGPPAVLLLQAAELGRLQFGLATAADSMEDGGRFGAPRGGAPGEFL
jgi:hypothetical protein